MKRRILMLLPALFLLVLTGCSCNHQWTAADCVNPQVCKECNEVGSPALGHDWIDATCTTPQTCSRCSATQGEALAHSYGDWTFGKEDMSRTCLVCNDLITTALDHELYLEALLDGYWDLWSVDHAYYSDSSTVDDIRNSYYSDSAHCGADAFYGGGDCSNYFLFGEGRSCQLLYAVTDVKIQGTGVWELAEYKDLGNERFYAIVVHMSDEDLEDITIVLWIAPDGMKRLGFFSNAGVFWYYQEQEDILEKISSNWVVSKLIMDQSYCFQLRPDRTATCYVEGVFEGTWCIGAHPDNIDGVGFSISYVRNGVEEAFIGDFVYSDPDLSGPTLYLYNSGPYIEFHEADDQELSTVQNATDLLAGTWTSFGYGMTNPRLADPLTTDYSITIKKNNKVTLELADGRSYAGSWEARFCSDTMYDYHLHFHDLDKTIECRLHITSDGLYLGLAEDLSDPNSTLYFKQLNDQQNAGLTLPVGTWTTTNIVDAGSNETVITNEYAITFREDGTFTARLERELSGTWQFFSYDEHTLHTSDSPDPVILDDWCYRLTFDGASEPMDIHIEEYRDDPGLQLAIKMNEPGKNQITYHFRKD